MSVVLIVSWFAHVIWHGYGVAGWAGAIAILLLSAVNSVMVYAVARVFGAYLRARPDPDVCSGSGQWAGASGVDSRRSPDSVRAEGLIAVGVLSGLCHLLVYFDYLGQGLSAWWQWVMSHF